MTVEPDSLDLATLATLAGDLSTAFLLEALRASGHRGVRTSHGYLFQHLIESEPTVGELADLLGVSQQAASKSVVELESMGLVTRQPDARDNRARRVALTGQGRRVIDDARSARSDLDARVLAAVGARRLHEAKATLATLVELVGGTDAIRQRRVLTK